MFPRTCLLALTLCLATKVLGQDRLNSSVVVLPIPTDETVDVHPNLLKITPLKLIGIINPAVELSYERRTGKRFSTEITASYLLPLRITDLGYDFKPRITGFTLAIEEKLYLKKSVPLGTYVSFEFHYLNNQYHDVWNFGVKNIYSDTAYSFTNYSDTFGIKKQTFSLNLKIGYQYVYKRVSIDFYAGLGLRFKDVKHFDRLIPTDEMEGPRHPNTTYISSLDGKYYTVSIPLNLRIGWTFP